MEHEILRRKAERAGLRKESDKGPSSPTRFPTRIPLPAGAATPTPTLVLAETGEALVRLGNAVSGF
jgi:hypothetical protein